MDPSLTSTPFWMNENYRYYWPYYFQPQTFSKWNQYEQNGAEEDPTWHSYTLKNQYGVVAELLIPVNPTNITALGSTYPLPDVRTSYYNVYDVPIEQLALSDVPEPYASMQSFGNGTISFWEVEQDCYYPLPSHFIDMNDFD